MNARKLALLIAVLSLTTTALAQSGGRFTMVRNVIAGGGGIGSTGGTFSLSGTIGQPGAALVTETRFQASIGFWIKPPLLIFAPEKTGNNFNLSFETEPGQTYIVEYTDSLLNPNWQPLPSQAGDGAVKSVTDSAPGIPSRYYRVRQQ